MSVCDFVYWFSRPGHTPRWREQVNVAHTRKKKRMDQELEAALELMASKKVCLLPCRFCGAWC